MVCIQIPRPGLPQQRCPSRHSTYGICRNVGVSAWCSRPLRVQTRSFCQCVRTAGSTAMPRLAVPDRARAPSCFPMSPFRLRTLARRLKNEPDQRRAEVASLPPGCTCSRRNHPCCFSSSSVSGLDSQGARAIRKRSKLFDPTTVTFPFAKDYVVHATHGIAHFTAIVRQEVAGRERLLPASEYATTIKSYVP